ncbi:hypothetical protein EGW08_019399 [Elysia chlorotica]|uniref:Uncharacterized protein n=1 Tax=Elysia chlorotica TaxID=188477 RepID=A0A3S1B1P0_ELYCH|nr:hypothetical protein EGW08_019399 [Elysia chlorotica]
MHHDDSRLLMQAEAYRRVVTSSNRCATRSDPTRHKPNSAGIYPTEMRTTVELRTSDISLLSICSIWCPVAQRLFQRAILVSRGYRVPPLFRCYGNDKQVAGRRTHKLENMFPLQRLVRYPAVGYMDKSSGGAMGKQTYQRVSENQMPQAHPTPVCSSTSPGIRNLSQGCGQQLKALLTGVRPPLPPGVSESAGGLGDVLGDVPAAFRQDQARQLLQAHTAVLQLAQNQGHTITPTRDKVLPESVEHRAPSGACLDLTNWRSNNLGHKAQWVVLFTSDMRTGVQISTEGWFRTRLVWDL